MTVAQVVNLVLLALLLYKLLYKPIGNLITSKQEQVKKELAEAKAREEQAQAQLAEYQTRIANAEKEAEAIVERARAAGEKAYAEIINEARREADRMLERAQREIEAEREQMIASIRSRMVDEAVLVSRQLALENLTEEDQVRIARKFIAEVEEFR